MLSVWEATHGLPLLHRVVFADLMCRADQRGITTATIGDLQYAATVQASRGRRKSGRPESINIRRIIDWYVGKKFITPIGNDRYLIPALAKINDRKVSQQMILSSQEESTTNSNNGSGNCSESVGSVAKVSQQMILSSQEESTTNSNNGSPNCSESVYRSDDRYKHYSEGVDINIVSTPDEIARLFETQFKFNPNTTRSQKVITVFTQWSRLGASEELIIEVVNQVNINAKASNAVPGSPSYYHKAVMQRLEQPNDTCEEPNPIDEWHSEQEPHDN